MQEYTAVGRFTKCIPAGFSSPFPSATYSHIKKEDGSGLRSSASSLATSFCKCFTNFLSATTWKYGLCHILEASHMNCETQDNMILTYWLLRQSMINDYTPCAICINRYNYWCMYVTLNILVGSIWGKMNCVSHRTSTNDVLCGQKAIKRLQNIIGDWSSILLLNN